MKKQTEEKKEKRKKEMAQAVGYLIKELADGNESALDKLYEVTGKWLLSWAKYYLVDKSYGEDVLSVVYVKIVDEAVNYREKNVLNWMIKIAKNVSLNFNRSISAVNEREVALIDNMVNANWEDDNLNRLFVENALRKLNPLELRCIYLRYWRLFTIEELSRILRIPASTLKYRIDKILLKLRGMLKDEEE